MKEYFVLFVSVDVAEQAGLSSSYLTHVGELYIARLRIPLLPWNIIRESVFYMCFDVQDSDRDRLRKAKSKNDAFMQQHIQKAIDLNIPPIRISE
jgi:hypothetical protein